MSAAMSAEYFSLMEQQMQCKQEHCIHKSRVAIKDILLTAQNCIAGETFAATSAEYFSLKQQLESESFAPEVPGGLQRFYSQLPHEERQKLLKQRLKKYCQRVRPQPSELFRPGMCQVRKSLSSYCSQDKSPCRAGCSAFARSCPMSSARSC